MAKDKNVIVSGNPSDREIRQSSSMTYFKGALTHTEMRILVKVVERVQHIFYGVSMKGLDSVPDLTREERTIRIPLRELEHGTNNTAVRTAANYWKILQRPPCILKFLTPVRTRRACQKVPIFSDSIFSFHQKNSRFNAALGA